MRTRVLMAFALLLTGVSQAQTGLTYADLEGWWSANPTHGGESSPVALQFLVVDGKPTARLSLIAIGAFDIALGEVEIKGDAVDTKGFSFPLTWDAANATLRGVLPADATPVYRVPVEFRRGEAFVKPAPPNWQGAKPKEKWVVDVGGAVWAGLARDAATGVFFVGNDAGVLQAIGEDGKVRWKFETGAPIRSEPALIKGQLYVASDSGYLYRLNPRSGAETWRAKIDTGSPPRLPGSDPKTRWDRYGSGIVADARRLYVTSRDKNLYALDINTGAHAWKYESGDIMTATPALYRDLVLIADYAGHVQAVGAADGKPRWSYDAKLGVAGDLVIDGDNVLVGSRSYDLVALDAATGRELWKHYYWFSWIESPPVVRGGTIYTGSSDATNVYALASADGALRWKTSVPGWAWARPAVNDQLVVQATAGNGAYPGFRAGSLVALERGSGAIRWLYLDPPAQAVVEARKNWGFVAAPLIVGNVVYAADLEGRLHAFTLD